MRKLTLAFQHPDFYVINKPAEAPMHANDTEISIVHQFSAELNEPLWPVHRLDTPTSGALIVARNAAAAATLSQLFAEQQITKYYLAIAAGKPKKKQGTIRGDMQKVRQGNWRLLRQQENPAVTHFTSHSLKPGYRYYVLQPVTGRTHQLRVALKSLGTPICGDARYGKDDFAYLHLHAWQLKFMYQQQQFEISVPWPDYELFQELPEHIAIPTK
ncbi:tRNA pseudouridine32 synthase / 23S rRNA pseudouridine746 synthase [Pseudidiomarina indica]|uniref:tRNA pseudouridine32 synthase / 23S rRNA pseudouridine746 synthase n=1 Tax=Pseudidiomarina indica TaxID=1159017 RepID=A0A1G6DBL1_9GAMM|nr:TIGR01621 family pseudouridine synthase [Pseudidiomarina indica]SDB42573.1 tRNA pseudouridine32 synthase / 23S rRNA pseudouridine746 synthase [Pseudidiomarina indica]